MDKTLLIIDDSAVSRAIIRKSASEFPYFNHIVEAASAEEGIAMMAEQGVGFVICDIQMPGASGFEFCSAIRSIPGKRDIPVLLITDKVELDNSHEDYVRCGADDYITKPFHNKELGARIHNVIRVRAMKDELDIRNIELSRRESSDGDKPTPNDSDQLNAELSAKMQRLMKMLSVQLTVGESLDFLELMELIIGNSREVMESEAASLMLLDQESGELVFMVAEGEKGDEVKKNRIKIGQGIAGWVAMTGEPAIVNDVSKDVRFFSGIDEKTNFRTRNIMCVPLRYKGRVTGVVEVINKKEGLPFEDSELELFSEFSNQIAVAIENFNLLLKLKSTNDKLLRRMEEISTLLDVQMALSGTLDLQDLLEMIITDSKEVMRAEAASLMLLDEDTNELVFQVAQGSAGDKLREIRIPMGQGIAGWVAQTGEAVVIADAQNDSRLYKKADEQSSFVTRNMICVPMQYKGDVIGVVQVLNKIGRDTFTESDMKLFCGFANQAAVAIVNVQLFNQRLEEEKARLEMRNMLDTYVSPEVAETLINNPEKLQLGGSRQIVSVMFSDLVGFTGFSENHQPEEVVRRLNDILSSMVEIIFGYHGTLDKFIGDAIMALYGVPLRQEDDAERAVRTAIAMQIALHEKRKTWAAENELGIYMGCAVHTGPAIVGNIGSVKRKDYTVIGDSVNVASRLEGLTRAYHKGIIISEETMRLLGSDFDTRELDIIHVKGRKEPLKIYSVEIPELAGVQVIP